jgi:hypothetical protein
LKKQISDPAERDDATLRRLVADCILQFLNQTVVHGTIQYWPQRQQNNNTACQHRRRTSAEMIEAA